MAERQAAEGEVGEQRLDVAEQRRALGRVADVTDRGVAGQGADHRLAAEVVADQAEDAVAVEQAAVEADHAGRLLAAVLERVQAEHGMGGRGVVAEDAEHAALLAQLVVDRRVPRSGHRLARHCLASSRAVRPSCSPPRRAASAAALPLLATFAGTNRRSRPAPSWT